MNDSGGLLVNLRFCMLWIMIALSLFRLATRGWNWVIFSFLTWTLIAGDLAFYDSILGKENMSSILCTWCKLSKSGWAHAENQPGECWTLDAMQQLWWNSAFGNLPNDAKNIQGCTELPLFNSVPIENYMVPALCLMIGAGIDLLESLLEWVSERIESLLIMR